MFRNDREQSGTTFYCFTPLVMILTCVIELSLAAYTVYRYKLDIKSRLLVKLLLFLAIFQACEYLISGNYGDPNVWSRIGFVAITFLPALGLHFIDSVGKPHYPRLVIAGYVLATIIAVYFVFVPDSLSSVCRGNYIIFHIPSSYSLLNGVYYYGVIAGYLYLARHKMSRTGDSKSEKIALASFSIGTLAFLIPTIIVAVLKPTVQEGIPSVMCGFALIFAFIIAFKVAPAIAAKR
jgi:hypothetical protein